MEGLAEQATLALARSSISLGLLRAIEYTWPTADLSMIQKWKPITASKPYQSTFLEAIASRLRPITSRAEAAVHRSTEGVLQILLPCISNWIAIWAVSKVTGAVLKWRRQREHDAIVRNGLTASLGEQQVLHDRHEVANAACIHHEQREFTNVHIRSLATAAGAVVCTYGICGLLSICMEGHPRHEQMHRIVVALSVAFGWSELSNMSI